METINFIFFWRLEYEKWVDILCDSLKFLDNENLLKKLNFEIYWDWKQKKILIQTLNQLKNKNLEVKYFWWKQKSYIMQRLNQMDFSLMPSRFLETFWLSALESISNWVWVIWFLKWWNDKFILDRLNIEKYEWDSLSIKLSKLILELIKTYNLDQKLYYKKKCIDISKDYWTQVFIDNFKKQFWENKKILIVSDFLTKIWWIEIYIDDVKELLEKNWYKIEVFWFDSKIWNISKIQRYLLMFFSFFNIYFALKLFFKMKNKNYDYIWFHSILRNIWWLWVFVSIFFESKKIITYHDFWVFHPFPSKIYKIEQLDYEFNLKNFILQSKTNNIFLILLVVWKYFLILPLKILLNKYFCVHIIPSEFMRDILIKSFNIENKKIFTLNHFKNY